MIKECKQIARNGYTKLKANHDLAEAIKEMLSYF